MEVIELKNLNKTYHLKNLNVPVLRGINLEIAQGEFVAVIGRSGSGKSTLLNILGLLDRPSDGSYKLAGVEVSGISDRELSVIRNQHLGFIFQQFNLLPKLTILANVALPAIYSPHENKELREDPLKLLNMVGLSDRLNHKPNEISGGQQQRVAIARALLNKPPIILADEPTGNLDIKSAKEIIQILKDLNNDGITVVMVTHEPEIAAYATRSIKIEDGAIVSDERITSAKNAVTRKLDRKALKKYKTFSFSRIKNYFSEAWKSLMHNKTRALLSALGVMIGVAGLIATLAIGSGAKNSIEKALSSLGTNILRITSGAVQRGGIYYKDRMRVGLKSEDVDDIKKNIPGVKGASGYIYDYAQIVADGKNYNTVVGGVSPDFADLANSHPSAGRFFTETENKEKTKVALLGKSVIKAVYKDENFNPVGRYVKINKIDFQVIGILPSKGLGAWGDEDDKIVIPLNTAMSKVFGAKMLLFIDTQVKTGADMNETSEAITRRILFTHRIPFYQREAIKVQNMLEIQKAALSSHKIFSFLLGSIAFISLLVGGVGIMNIMFASVSERTKEIGLRKALGANRTDILLQFIIESTFICCIGGFIGILLGWGGTLLVVNVFCKQAFGFEACVTYFSIMLAFCFAELTGLIFAIWPARKASLLNPIDALRHE
jgi:macrolide transport system ATP-binding/permease protein